MVMNIQVLVLTPNRFICSTTAEEVILPGLTGKMGVLDGHATVVTALDTGLLRIKVDGKWTPIILHGGLAEIDRNRVTVLANEVEDLVDFELSKAAKDLEDATEILLGAETSKVRMDAVFEIKRATARVEAINLLS
jgi:F-type H+-transporting ATPase subunit epsilon